LLPVKSLAGIKRMFFFKMNGFEDEEAVMAIFFLLSG